MLHVRSAIDRIPRLSLTKREYLLNFSTIFRSCASIKRQFNKMYAKYFSLELAHAYFIVYFNFLIRKLFQIKKQKKKSSGVRRRRYGVPTSNVYR